MNSLTHWKPRVQPGLAEIARDRTPPEPEAESTEAREWREAYELGYTMADLVGLTVPPAGLGRFAAAAWREGFAAWQADWDARTAGIIEARESAWMEPEGRHDTFDFDFDELN